MRTTIRYVLILCPLLVGACTDSEPMTPEEALSQIPDELRIFEGQQEAFNKAMQTANTLQDGADRERAIIDRH